MRVSSREAEIMERRYAKPYNWEIAPHSRRWRQKMGLWKLVSELAGELRGRRVLDAGCGDGWYSARLVEAGAEVTGIDYSSRAIEFATSLVPAASFSAVPLSQVPCADESFDIIFAIQVLEHVPPDELPETIRELARVLKQEGVFVASVPSVMRPKSDAHFQHFTIESFREVLAPFFAVERVLGQERRTSLLHVLERVYENRFWFFTPAAKLFNEALFFPLWNRTLPEHGQNLVVLSRKR